LKGTWDLGARGLSVRLRAAEETETTQGWASAGSRGPWISVSDRGNAAVIFIFIYFLIIFCPLELSFASLIQIIASSR
jgi:hypothetical protein